MTSFVKNVVLIEVDGVQPNVIYDFGQFLRREMITPGVKMEGSSGNGHGSYFKGCFTHEQAARIVEWFSQNGVEISMP